jgi:hypothetical protein
MIRKVLVVGQGPNDVGFLRGIRDRLKCEAELIDYRSVPLLRQRGSYTRRTDARLIWSEAQRLGVDLVVRLTDGDITQPAQVAQDEIERFPVGARERLVCGVCNRDIEHWICLDPRYCAKEFGFDVADLPEERAARSGFIKNRITKMVSTGSSYDEVVATYVLRAPTETLKQWLSDPAFARFYDDCRRAALREECSVETER